MKMNKYTAPLLATSLALGLGGCSSAHEAPNAGVISSIADDTEAIYENKFVCSYGIKPDGKLGTTCNNQYVYDHTALTSVISIDGCKPSGNSHEFIDEAYAKKHSEYPSDYPLSPPNTSFSKNVDGTETIVDCSSTFEIPREIAKFYKLGGFATASELAEASNHVD